MTRSTAAATNKEPSRNELFERAERACREACKIVEWTKEIVGQAEQAGHLSLLYGDFPQMAAEERQVGRWKRGEQPISDFISAEIILFFI